MKIDAFPLVTIKILLAWAALLLLFYVSSIPDEHLAAALSIAILIFLLDIFWLRHITRGLTNKLKATTCVHRTIESHFKKVLPTSWLFSVFKQEMLVVFYTFFAANYRPAPCNSKDSFSYHQASNSRDVFWLVFTTQLPTLPFIHFFIEHQGNGFAAWVVTVLTLWSVLYFYAQQSAIQFRPIELTDNQLVYRYGLSWQADIPLKNIKSARLINIADQADYFEHFTSPFGSNKNLILEFHEPVTFFGSYLIRKRRKKALIAIDEPQALIKSLKQKSGSAISKR